MKSPSDDRLSETKGQRPPIIKRDIHKRGNAEFSRKMAVIPSIMSGIKIANSYHKINTQSSEKKQMRRPGKFENTNLQY